MAPSIQLRGVRQNNLKGFDLDIPLNRLTVVTGVSGSGKSSPGFRHALCRGPASLCRDFLSPMHVNLWTAWTGRKWIRSSGVPPAIAIDRKDPVRTSRSSVGTMTELNRLREVAFRPSRGLALPELRATGSAPMRPIRSPVV